MSGKGIISNTNDTTNKNNEIQRYPNELVLMRKAVEASGEIVFMTDQEGIITYINPEFTRLYGYQGTEVVGKATPRILKSGMMTPQDYERFWEALLNKQIVKREFVNKCKEGNLVTIESSANPIIDENDRIIGFLAIQRDITDRKKAQEAIEAAHLFQQSIIDGIADPIMVIGTDYRVTLMNQAAQEFASLEQEPKSTSRCHKISHEREFPCDGLEHPCPLAQVKESGKTVIVEHRHYQANGESRLVEVVASPFWGTDGGFQGIIEVMRDITERIHDKEKLQQYTNRLRALAAQLAEVAETERKWLAQELHDQIGQNLTALGINLNIIRSQLPDTIGESIHFHLDDSVSLVEQTTERIRNVMADLHPPVLDDYGLVAALHWFAGQFTHRTGISVMIDGEEPAPRLGNRTENALFRIVQEAMTNVSKHAKATHVTLKVYADDKSFQLRVCDNGIGFDPTQNLEFHEGMGWGLLSMKERAEAVNGRFSIESVPGGGTSVIVELTP